MCPGKPTPTRCGGVLSPPWPISFRPVAESQHPTSLLPNIHPHKCAAVSIHGPGPSASGLWPRGQHPSSASDSQTGSSTQWCGSVRSLPWPISCRPAVVRPTPTTQPMEGSYQPSHHSASRQCDGGRSVSATMTNRGTSGHIRQLRVPSNVIGGSVAVLALPLPESSGNGNNIMVVVVIGFLSGFWGELSRLTVVRELNPRRAVCEVNPPNPPKSGQKPLKTSERSDQPWQNFVSNFLPNCLINSFLSNHK